jgi:hypothetical protein
MASLVDEEKAAAAALDRSVNTTSVPGSASERHAVTVTLTSEAYNHYEKLAKEDDRSLAKYLARLLQRNFESRTIPGANSPMTFRG